MQSLIIIFYSQNLGGAEIRARVFKHPLVYSLEMLSYYVLELLGGDTLLRI